MTQNQLAYQANLERERSNKAIEEETKRANLEKEKETRRKNFSDRFVSIWRTILGR